MKLERMNFNVDLIEIPITIGGEDYVLREASGDAGCKYRNALLACTTLTDGKPSRIEGMADVEPLLVSLCLFTQGGRPVTVPKVRSWPSRVVKALFEKIKEISDLDEEEEDEEGNRVENPTQEIEPIDSADG